MWCDPLFKCGVLTAGEESDRAPDITKETLWLNAHHEKSATGAFLTVEKPWLFHIYRTSTFRNVGNSNFRNKTVNTAPQMVLVLSECSVLVRCIIEACLCSNAEQGLASWSFLPKHVFSFTQCTYVVSLQTDK